MIKQPKTKYSYELFSIVQRIRYKGYEKEIFIKQGGMGVYRSVN